MQLQAPLAINISLTQLVYEDNRIRRTVESDRRGRCLSKGKDKGREGTAGKGGKDM